MEFVAIAIVSFLLMFLMIKLFKNSNNRVKSQIIAVSVVLILVIIAYYKNFTSVQNTISYIVSMVIPYVIAIYLILRNTNFLRRMKFNKDKSDFKLYGEKMYSSKYLRKRLILSIVLLYAGVVTLLIFTIIDFNWLMLFTTIAGFVLVTIYTVYCFKMGITNKSEPVRKLILLVETDTLKAYSVEGLEDVFDTSKYLDIIREKYYYKPFCKVTLTTDNSYEMHAVYYLKIDQFETFDFLKEDDYSFYKDLIKKEEYGIPYYVVNKIDGKYNFERIK